MRIRSIRPEFWTSEDVAAMDWHTRLVFIGLWSYVDDNGVGRDNERLIAADLFPLDEDPRESVARVSRGLLGLSAGGQITRYTVEGKPYLHIASWELHQRVDKRAKDRYPLPTCGNAIPRETVATPSRDRREGVAPGEGEKGRRGEGEKGHSEPATQVRALALRDSSPAPDDGDESISTQTLVGEWIDHCQDRPPGRVIGQVSKELKQMLAEGIDPDRVRAGLVEWNRRGLHPATLPSVVHEISNRVVVSSRQVTTDDLFARAEARMTATARQEIQG